MSLAGLVSADISDGPLEWPIADHSRAMHLSGINVVVVWLGRVHGASVVPEDKIAGAPFVAMHEGRLGAMVM